MLEQEAKVTAVLAEKEKHVSPKVLKAKIENKRYH